MQKITFEQASKSYNGRVGCMCGCNGSYKLKSADDIDAANKSTGYEAYGEEDVSPRSVKIAVRKCNEAIEQYADLAKPVPGSDAVMYRGEGVCFMACDAYVSIERGERNTTVYLKKAA